MIPSSTATVDQLVTAVESMAHSGPVGISPKHISWDLRQKLEDVAALHRGLGAEAIPVHGRLIAQWLHYVFPQECPYPHMHKLEPLAPLQYEEIHGEDSTNVDTEDVIEWLQAAPARLAPSPEAGHSMWNLHEDTFEASTPSDAEWLLTLGGFYFKESALRKGLRVCAYLGMLSGLGALVLQALLSAIKEVKKYKIVKVDYSV